ncbi:MAG: hypothetical protein KC636_23220, partial [Myxococcales bacterium]|nr:hypothetical protein [Myxococcales bacterium]
MSERPPLAGRLVLAPYLLAQLGCDSLEPLAAALRDPALERAGDGAALHDALARFARERGAPLAGAPLDRLGEAVARHTRALVEARGPLRWRYFQYVALLLCERYLERYFADP